MATISGIIIIINNNNKFQEDLGDLDPVTGAWVISAGGQTILHDRTAPAPPLFTGSISCGLCMLLFAIVGAVKPNSIAGANILAACARVYLFAYGATIASTIWLYFELPETKDRTLEGIDDMFLNANCTGPVYISRRWLPLIQCHYYFVLCALAQVFPSKVFPPENSNATSAPAKSGMVING
ncbi:uncharacterized protein G6M90_00g064380 [Metarhizium brunneum]|uniref:Uncharacterized protein n=1 Tax=Metarhizium brunneum TaxID=500148 RepID=A0A7D5Z6W3_9HYPO|nr:hypothetical protein G6M90_00g064380 [Metarhizium brunneum]